MSNPISKLDKAMKMGFSSEPDRALPRLAWLWPAVIAFSAFAAVLVTFSSVVAPLRPWVTYWFLLVCPGMAFVPLLRLRDGLTEWILAIPLSLAVDALVAGIMGYAGAWSPEYGVLFLAVISLAGALLQEEFTYGYVKKWLSSSTRR